MEEWIKQLNTKAKLNGKLKKYFEFSKSESICRQLEKNI